MKSILSKDFQYVPSHLTNIQERFDRIKREAKQKAKAQEASQSKDVQKVTTLPRKEKHG